MSTFAAEVAAAYAADGPTIEMAPAGDVAAAARASPLWARYGPRTETESARELLAARLEAASAPPPPVEAPSEHLPIPKRRRAPAPPRDGDALGDLLGSHHAKQLQKEVVRGVLGLLRKRL